MTTAERGTPPALWKGAVAGLAAGLLASLAMDRFQAALNALSPDEDQGEPATQKAADRLAAAVTGHAVPDEHKAMAGQAVHYALGTVLGVAYGMTAEVQPGVTSGYGTLFGTGVAGLLDEGAVPAAGLSKTPWHTPATTHAYTIASHLVFGTAAEATRRLVRRLLD